MTEQTPASGWKEQKKPPIMTRRFDFASYEKTRKFLDDLAELSERTGYYPDLNFSKTHVNVSIASNGASLGDAEYSFAEQTTALASRSA